MSTNPSPTSVASPKEFGDQLSNLVKAIGLSLGKNPKAVLEYWHNICQFDFDLSRGELAWLKGTFLNRLYHIDPTKKGVLKKKEWKAWRDANAANETDETLRNWKKVADQFTRANARKLGLSEMYARIRGDAAAARIKSNKKTPKPPVREKTTRPVPIAEFVDCWAVVNEQLEGMSMVGNAPDRFDDPKDKLDTLDAQETNIKTARLMLDDLEKAIATTRKELEEYIAEEAESFAPPTKEEWDKAGKDVAVAIAKPKKKFLTVTPKKPSREIKNKDHLLKKNAHKWFT